MLSTTSRLATRTELLLTRQPPGLEAQSIPSSARPSQQINPSRITAKVLRFVLPHSTLVPSAPKSETALYLHSITSFTLAIRVLAQTEVRPNGGSALRAAASCPT